MDVIVSAFNEERYIERALRAVLAQDYPKQLCSVLFVDGGSRDQTVAIARRLAAAEPRLKVIAKGRLNLPQALNVGLGVTGGELVAKVDAHGYVETDYLRRAVEAFASCSADVAAVGGRPVQEGETPWGCAVARARTSRFGTGGSVYAGNSPREFVDTLQCAIYRRSALDTVGHFDPSAAYGEDDELNWRLRENGYRLLLDNAIRFHYVTRPTLLGVCCQYRNYGRAKVRVAAAHPRWVRPWHFVPAVSLVAGSLLAAGAVRSSTARHAAVGAALTYAVAAGTAATLSSGPKDAASLARVATCFAAIHLGYATGMLGGIMSLTQAIQKPWYGRGMRTATSPGSPVARP